MNTNEHTVLLEHRTRLSVTAVDEVISFDEELVSLAIGDAVLNVSGEGLSIQTLSIDCGQVKINGNVNAMVYFDNAPRKKRFSVFGKK